MDDSGVSVSVMLTHALTYAHVNQCEYISSDYLQSLSCTCSVKCVNKSKQIVDMLNIYTTQITAYRTHLHTHTHILYTQILYLKVIPFSSSIVLTRSLPGLHPQRISQQPAGWVKFISCTSHEKPTGDTQANECKQVLLLFVTVQ